MLAAEEILCARAHELLDGACMACAAALQRAVGERAALEVGGERRHGVDRRDQREGAALPLDLVLQEGEDRGVKCLQMVQHVLSFHDILLVCHELTGSPVGTPVMR